MATGETTTNRRKEIIVTDGLAVLKSAFQRSDTPVIKFTNIPMGPAINVVDHNADTKPPEEPLPPLPGRVTFDVSPRELAAQIGLVSNRTTQFSNDPIRSVRREDFDTRAHLRRIRWGQFLSRISRIFHW